jgi:hypothetical protein
MAQYDKKIIQKLLDIYENSLLSVGENRRTVHIDMPFNKKNIPEYFDESNDEYEQIHIAMRMLEEQGLIEIIWKNGKVNHLIQKVRLSVENVDSAYGYIKRNPKWNQVKDLIQWLRDYYEENVSGQASGNDESSVLQNFLLFLINRLQQHQSVKEYINLELLSETGALLDAIRFVEKNETPCYIREFSIEHFQDSKKFENMENKVAKIFRKFEPQYKELDTAEIMAEHYIYHTPNYVYLKGNVTIRIDGKRIDLSLFQQGLGLSGEDIEKITFDNVEHLSSVITIENLTTFFRCKLEHGLIIYLGGYHNRIRRNLLEKIYAGNPSTKYYHFGDIDAGGFYIYLDLCNKTKIPFQTLYMDLKTLMAHEKYGKRLTESDRNRLIKLKEQGFFIEIIDYMLENNVKLEQECVEINTLL